LHIHVLSLGLTSQWDLTGGSVIALHSVVEKCWNGLDGPSQWL